MDYEALLREQLQAFEAKEGHAVATIVSTEGSTSRTSGKMLVYADGRVSGTVGGGSVERHAIRDALRCIEKGENALFEYDHRGENASIGLACGGVVRVLIEVFCIRPQLVICGAGHVSGALMRVARLTGFHITLIDTREDEIVGERAVLADTFVRVKAFEEGLLQLDVQKGAYYVIATYGHLHDADALYAALQKDARYVGMLGSAEKKKALFERLRVRGVAEELLQTVRTPIGLDIGGETPEEIAIAVMAELLMVKHGKRVAFSNQE